MKQFLTFTFSIFLTSLFSLSEGFEKQDSGIQWQTNYKEAIKTARASSKPILLYFTGSDWCSWCTKLEKEALSTPEFAEATADKFVFVKLDFPLYSSLSPQITAQNKEEQKNFDVRGFPTILIIDPKTLTQIGTTGYRPGGGKAYAAHLNKIVNDYAMYRQKTQNMEKEKLAGIELKQLYEKAREIKAQEDINKIVSQGLNSDQQVFFQIEHYQMLVDAGQVKAPEAAVLKQRLLASDPSNANLTHYQVAVIDFEAACAAVEKNNTPPDITVAALVNYINTFGANDKENLWRLQMIISQVYFDKQKVPEALKYAKSALDSAPSSVKADIASAINNMQSQVTAAR